MTTDPANQPTVTKRRFLKATGSTGLASLGFAGSAVAQADAGADRDRTGRRRGQLTGDVAASEQYRHLRSILREDGFRPELGRASFEERPSSDLPEMLSNVAGQYLQIPCAESHTHDDLDHPGNRTVEVVAFAPEGSDDLELTAIARQESVPIATVYTDDEVVQTAMGHVASPEGGH